MVANGGVQPQSLQLSDFAPITATATVSYVIESSEGAVFARQFQEHLEKQAGTARQAVGQKIVQLSNEMQIALFQYGKDAGRQIPILSTETLYICQSCNRIVSVDWFQAASCKCGKGISNTSDIVMLPAKTGHLI